MRQNGSCQLLASSGHRLSRLLSQFGPNPRLVSGSVGSARHHTTERKFL